jgi:hypothetical protein
LLLVNTIDGNRFLCAYSRQFVELVSLGVMPKQWNSAIF